MAKYQQIYIDVYKRSIFIFLGSHKEFKLWVQDYFKDDSDYSDFARYVEDKESNNPQGTFWYNTNIGEGVIELKKFPKTAKEIATATHECLHAVFHILDYCGVEYNPNSSGESHTYLLEYIVANLLNINNYKNYDT